MSSIPSSTMTMMTTNSNPNNDDTSNSNNSRTPSSSLSRLFESDVQSRRPNTSSGAATVSGSGGGGDMMMMKPRYRNSSNSGSATVVGDTPSSTSTSEIYIRADGKKVRRIKKTVLRSNNNNPVDADGVDHPNNTTRNTTSSNSSSSSDKHPTTTITSSEIYIRPDGKKVRRITRTKSSMIGPTSNSNSSNNSTAVPSTTTSTSNTSLGNFLNVDTNSNITNNTTFRGSATVIGMEQQPRPEGEIYIRADGKKVRRIKKSSVHMTNTPTIQNTDTSTSTSTTTNNNNNFMNSHPTTSDPTMSHGSNNSIATTITNTSLASTTMFHNNDNDTLSNNYTTSNDDNNSNANNNNNNNDNAIITKSEVYINAEGKKVRRVMKQKNKDPTLTTATTTMDGMTTTTATATTTTNTSLPTTPNPLALAGYLDQMSPKRSPKVSLRGSASVSGSTPSQQYSGGEIYINAQGKKVRRVLKPKSTGSHSISSGIEQTKGPQHESFNVVSSSATVVTTPVSTQNNNNNNKSNTIAEGEIYIRADGKKVRRVKRSNSNVIGSPTTSVPSLPLSSSIPAATTDTTITSNHEGNPSPSPPPPPIASPLSPLDGFLVKHSPRRTKGTITGSATVAGDRVSSKIDGGEIYINAQGKKVRRVRKPKPPTLSSATTTTPVAAETMTTMTSPSSTTTTANHTMTATETTIANARTHLGVTQSILLERAAAKIQKAEMEQDRQQQQEQVQNDKQLQQEQNEPVNDGTTITSPTTIVTTIDKPLGENINSTPRNSEPNTPNDDTAISTNDTLDTPTHTALIDGMSNNDIISKNDDATSARTSDPIQSSWSSTNPPKTDPNTRDMSTSNTTTPTATATFTEQSEIYINADGKKVRRIRRSPSIRSTSSSVENGLPGSGSNRSMDASTTSSTDSNKNANNTMDSSVGKSNNNSQLGEIYIRPDGKKVRRVRRHQSTDSALALGMFLHESSGNNKPTLSGSATVVGDRKLDGEIIIRPDGKKVIRRAKSLMSSNASTTGGEASTTASATQPIGEIFRNADGKLVRRVKRTVSKNAEPLNNPPSDATSTDTIEEKKTIETPAPNNPAVQLTDDEEIIAKGYRKMKNMGIPEDAVRHKMAVSEVHPKIIAAVMGEKWNDPETTSASTQMQQSSPTNMSIQLTSEEEVIAAVYRKMQKMGLPQDAVRHKMIVNEVAPKIVAAVLGEEWKGSGTPKLSAAADSPVEPKSLPSSIELTGGEEMIASVYRKLQKMGLTDDAVRHKMVTSNVHPKIIAAVLNEEWVDESKGNESTPNVSMGPSLTNEEEEVAAPFRKMQKIGFSNDAVRHKMIMSEVHPKIMAAVLGEQWTDDSKPPVEPSTAGATALTDDEEAIVAKYKRMLKAGIPIDSVRHKMTSESVDTRLIAIVLGEDNKIPEKNVAVSATLAKLTDDEELIGAQYRKMRRMGLPDDAIRHKMIVNEVDPRIISAFFNEEQQADSNNDNSMSTSQPAVPTATPKASGAVAYVVVVGDEEATENALPVSINDQVPISLNPEEKFAVKVADEANPESGTKQTRFYTLDELARLSGQSKSELEAIVKEKKQRGLSPPKFSLQPLQEPKYEVSVPMTSSNVTTPSEKPTSPSVNATGSNVTSIKEGQEVVDSDIAKAARAVSALADGDMSKLLEKLKMGDMKDLLEKLYEAEKRQKKLEKQLAQAGVAIAEDIDYQEALSKVGEIAKRMNEIGGSDVVVADKAEQNRLREEYFKLEQEMERYNTALVLSEEYQAEQDRLELKWEADNEPLNIEALKKIRRHMPVNIRHLSEADLTTKPSPNGKYLPVVIAKKFKRTNILQCLRLNPDDLECMHPATLENMRVTGLTLTERRALYIHFKPIGPKWEKNKAEKMTERKWTWYQMMRNNFKENVAPFQRHIDQYGGPENHTCPLLGKQCPIRADKNPDYDGDYGWTEAAEYEVSDVRKADVEDSGAKAKAEALELTKAKKANERADLLKKHYKGKLLQVSKANGSCEGMDEAMDQMENNTARWTENMLDKADQYTDVDKKKEVANFMDALNEYKLKLLAFAQRSGMQMSGKKTDGGDSTDIRSLVEGSLSEEMFEASKEFFAFIRMRLKKLDIVDTRCIKTIEMLEGYLNDLHGRNMALFEALGAKRMNRSRKLKTNKDIQKEVEEKNKPTEPEPPAVEAPGRPGPPMGGGGRGGLMDAIAGRGRGGGGRGGLLDAIAGRGRGRGRGDGGGGGRGGLLDAIAGRGRGGGGDKGGRGGLLDAIAGRGRGRGGDSGGGRGDLLSAIAGRGRGGGDGGGRGGLLAAIAARGGGGD